MTICLLHPAEKLIEIYSEFWSHFRLLCATKVAFLREICDYYLSSFSIAHIETTYNLKVED